MANPVGKFKRLIGLNAPEAEETSSPKREPISLKRKLFTPSYRKKNGKVEPTDVREYQDDYGIYQKEEVPLMGARFNRKRK